MLHRLPTDPTPEQMDAAYAAGLLRKEHLEHGQYYAGRCRNAKVARWHAGAQCFVHWREKFGSRFLERIKHPVDEKHFDVFLAQELVAPGEDAIADDRFEQFVEQEKTRGRI